jgi:hypothetical protein
MGGSRIQNSDDGELHGGEDVCALVLDGYPRVRIGSEYTRNIGRGASRRSDHMRKSDDGRRKLTSLRTLLLRQLRAAEQEASWVDVSKGCCETIHICRLLTGPWSSFAGGSSFVMLYVITG